MGASTLCGVRSGEESTNTEDSDLSVRLAENCDQWSSFADEWLGQVGDGPAVLHFSDPTDGRRLQNCGEPKLKEKRRQEDL
jgi:hypothetical protein